MKMLKCDWKPAKELKSFKTINSFAQNHFIVFRMRQFIVDFLILTIN